MRALLKTLLLIALLVQLPLGAFAAYSDLGHSLEAQHSHEHADHSHHHDAKQDSQADESHASNSCGSHHHCGGAHLSALPTSRLQTPVSSSRQVFGISSDMLISSAAHTRIERPNWASL